MGHSTGCQDVLRLSRKLIQGGLDTVALASAIKGLILQAPVRSLLARSPGLPGDQSKCTAPESCVWHACLARQHCVMCVSGMCV
jgi:Protein of unknown function (DUF1749)